jgi:hypothetical protein
VVERTVERPVHRDIGRSFYDAPETALLQVDDRAIFGWAWLVRAEEGAEDRRLAPLQRPRE